MQFAHIRHPAGSADGTMDTLRLIILDNEWREADAVTRQQDVCGSCCSRSFIAAQQKAGAVGRRSNAVEPRRDATRLTAAEIQ